jgi:uncharacterized protein YbjQ (UPF0145 family)
MAAIITGLSGNEIYCLEKQNLSPGDIAIGNSVISLGLIGSVVSGFKTLIGGEIEPITRIIHEGRDRAYNRIVKDATKRGCVGITGVTSELIFHGSNVEFLSIGSCVHRDEQTTEQFEFSSSGDGQSLYCLIDCGFTPKQFVFGNVAYSIGLGGGLLGSLKSLARGEIKEFSDIFNQTRHLALSRIKSEARKVGANAVLGINTSIFPLGGVQEMLMIGTAAYHQDLPDVYRQSPLSSDLTLEETWNMINQGYMPVQLVLGASVYSLGLVGSITSAFKSFSRGEISELTSLIYEAREQALKYIEKDARSSGADRVIGVKTYVYNLGGGMIEFLAIGTAVRKMDQIGTTSDQLLPQAIIRDQETFINTAQDIPSVSLNAPTNNSSSFGIIGGVASSIFVILFFLIRLSFR